MSKTLEEKLNEIQARFLEELKSVRTGRAHASLVDNISVEAYGTKQALKNLASISATDPRTIVIEPWDKSLIKEVEKGISSSPLGLSAIVEANILRIKLPEPTEEGRVRMVKIIREKLEESKVKVRQGRDEAKRDIENKKRSAEITEDDKYQAIEQLDKKTKIAISALEEAASKKEKEVMLL